MENNKETSFERMNQAVREMVKEDLGVEVIDCQSHTSSTLKVVAHPEAVNTVEVFVPYQIFVGAKTNAVCNNWEVGYWKMALRQLCLEFGVKDCPRTRLMTRKVGKVDPRMYADFFWKRIESMNGWNIVLPEIPVTEPVVPETICQQNTDDTGAEKATATNDKYDIKKAYEMLGLKFACL